METTTTVQQLPLVQIPKERHTLPPEKYFAAAPGQMYKAVYIDNKARKATIENYLLYVDLYNQEVKKYRVAVDDYNAQVEKNLEDRGLSDIQKAYVQIFAAKNWNKPPKISQKEWKLSAYCPTRALKLTPRNTYSYNLLVQEFNAAYGMVLPKIRPQQLKNQTKDLFQTILYWYSGAIGQYSQSCYHSSIITEYPLIPLQWNNYNLANSKRDNGARNTNLTSRTIATHRNRLEEAGILIDGAFHGSSAATTAYINPDILVVFDPELSRNRITENQSLNTNFKKKLLDKYVSTYFLDKDIDKENKKDSLSLNTNNCFYLPTTAQSEKSQLGAAAPDVKKPAHLLPNERASQQIREKTAAPVTLANELLEEKHLETTSLDPNHLHKEAVNGTLNREEFALYLVQQLIKEFSHLWKGKKVVVGSWINAVKLMNAHFFKHHGKYVSRLVMIDHYYAHLERLKQIEKYCRKHPEYDLRYPSVFFNPVNNTKSSGGYAVTHKWFLKLLKDRKAAATAADKALADRKRKQHRNARRTKMVTITRRYLRGHINEAQLFMHVSSNLAEYKNQISKFITEQREFIEKQP